MPRTARAVVSGCAYHVTQRGNNRQDVFFVDADRRAYLGYLREAAGRFGLRVEGYCLMTNHVHLVVTPQQEASLPEALKRTNQLYAQYVNRLHSRSGHLWQDRFYSCPLDDHHLWWALAYVERNPVRARLCSRPWEWRWSSAGAHAGGGDPSSLLDLASWNRSMDYATWRRVLEQSDEEELLTRLRLATSRGHPLGSDAFIAKLETFLGRRLRALPPGRPRRPPQQCVESRGETQP